MWTDDPLLSYDPKNYSNIDCIKEISNLQKDIHF
jgi:hypothetical protein